MLTPSRWIYKSIPAVAGTHPIGIQFISRRGEDADRLSVSVAYEQFRDNH